MRFIFTYKALIPRVPESPGFLTCEPRDGAGGHFRFVFTRVDGIVYGFDYQEDVPIPKTYKVWPIRSIRGGYWEFEYDRSQPLHSFIREHLPEWYMEHLL